MNQRNPILKRTVGHFLAYGTSYCGELPATISVNGPNEIILECGHVVDAKGWIDSHYRDDDPDASELEATNDG